jgi:hypothetical protein
VKKNGTTIFGTKPTIDASETTTDTAATPAVISDHQPRQRRHRHHPHRPDRQHHRQRLHREVIRIGQMSLYCFIATAPMVARRSLMPQATLQFPLKATLK